MHIFFSTELSLTSRDFHSILFHLPQSPRTLGIHLPKHSPPKLKRQLPCPYHGPNIHYPSSSSQQDGARLIISNFLPSKGSLKALRLSLSLFKCENSDLTQYFHCSLTTSECRVIHILPDLSTNSYTATDPGKTVPLKLN